MSFFGKTVSAVPSHALIGHHATAAPDVPAGGWVNLNPVAAVP
jgi:hypothetical protein